MNHYFCNFDIYSWMPNQNHYLYDANLMSLKLMFFFLTTFCTQVCVTLQIIVTWGRSKKRRNEREAFDMLPIERKTHQSPLHEVPLFSLTIQMQVVLRVEWIFKRLSLLCKHTCRYLPKLLNKPTENVAYRNKFERSLWSLKK
jgi:hypothetical protein